jgi:hypothetical protein
MIRITSITRIVYSIVALLDESITQEVDHLPVERAEELVRIEGMMSWRRSGDPPFVKSLGGDAAHAGDEVSALHGADHVTGQIDLVPT